MTCGDEQCKLERQRDVARKNAAKSYERKKDYHHTCVQCGTAFTSKSQTSKCCSNKCRYQRGNMSRNGPLRQDRDCMYCGKEFTTTDLRVVTCSERCRRERKLQGQAEWRESERRKLAAMLANAKKESTR